MDPTHQADPNNNRHPPHGRANRATGGALGNVRDRLFHALFVRLALAYARCFPHPIRRILEFCVLLKALFFLSILIYVHFVFTHHPATCLDQLKGYWPRDGVLRVEIFHPDALHPHQSDLYDSEADESDAQTIEYTIGTDNGRHSYAYPPYVNLSSSYNERGQPICEAQYPGDSPTCVAEDRAYLPHHIVPHTQLAPGIVLSDPLIKKHTQHVATDSENLYEPSWTELLLDAIFPQETWTEDHSIIEYSTEFGFLRLSEHMRVKLGIPVKVVSLDPLHNSCFGGNISRALLDSLLGYDDIVMSSIKALAESESNGNLGYVRNVLTGEHYKFVSMSVTRLSYLTAFFIMLVFTFVISMLLRYSHHQIFTFIIDLLQMLELNTPLVFPAAPLLIVILALVGMEAIMSEFFNDTSTAFYIILLVWCADQYDAICCHSSISKRYWLRFFFLYHFTFYAYHYRFNGQYGGLALLTSWLFIQHSMIYFFHHYELPLILQQQHVQNLINNLQQNTNAAATASDGAPNAPVLAGTIEERGQAQPARVWNFEVYVQSRNTARTPGPAGNVPTGEINPGASAAAGEAPSAPRETQGASPPPVVAEQRTDLELD